MLTCDHTKELKQPAVFSSAPESLTRCRCARVRVCTCHLEACMHPWTSAPPASVSWKASVRPSSSPRGALTLPARPPSARLREEKSRVC